MEKIKEFVSKYQNINLTNISFEEVRNDIEKVIIGIPFPTVSPRIGQYLERIRNNYNGEIFNSIENISCRIDYENIAECGRANLPKNSIFYGTLITEEMRYARITNVLETSKALRNKENDSFSRQIFTSGQWRVKEKMRLLVLPFPNEEYLKSEISIKTNEIFLSELKQQYPETHGEMILLLNFFSNEFSKPNINSHHDYKITATLTDIFYKKYHYDGILYPSVRADYTSQNIAIKSEAAHKIELEKAAIFELFVNGKQSLIDNIAGAIDLGKDKKNFNWIYTERTDFETIKEILKL
jgi:hypothetical protein